jgi:hypothetical protein
MKIEVDGYGQVMSMKDSHGLNQTSSSYRDFGGCYLVGGRYLYFSKSSEIELLSMVDLNFTKEWYSNKAIFESQNTSTEIEEVNKDFRDLSSFQDLRIVDSSLLYEVLLHQENYISVIHEVIKKTRKSIHVAQPVLKENTFPNPSSSTLLQFWPENLKDEFRMGSFWPKEKRVDLFETNYWMWGHTTSHLNDVFKGFGWELENSVEVTNVCGEKWDYLLSKYVPSNIKN